MPSIKLKIPRHTKKHENITLNRKKTKSRLTNGKNQKISRQGFKEDFINILIDVKKKITYEYKEGGNLSREI